MLHQLLQIIASGSVHTLKQLALQLDVSEALLDSMMDELVRRGYLRLVSATCCGDCGHCPMSSTCAVGSPGRVWVLTQAGQKIVQSA